jgi:hypothetical protein
MGVTIWTLQRQQNTNTLMALRSVMTNITKSKRSLEKALTNPRDMKWLRGPARIENDRIVLDVNKAEFYNPMRQPDVGEELARVRNDREALVFTTRFGPLWDQGTAAMINSGWPSDSIEKTISLKITNLREHAGTLRRIITQVIRVRRAAKDPKVVKRIRDTWNFVLGDRPDELKRIQAMSDRSILEHEMESVTLLLSSGLGGGICVYDRSVIGEPNCEPGQIRIGIQPSTLLDVCYLQVAFALTEGVEFLECERCRTLFQPHDGRQRFCTPTCNAKTRIDRMRIKNAEAVKRPRAGKKKGTRR